MYDILRSTVSTCDKGQPFKVDLSTGCHKLVDVLGVLVGHGQVGCYVVGALSIIKD